MRKEIPIRHVSQSAQDAIVLVMDKHPNHAKIHDGMDLAESECWLCQAAEVAKQRLASPTIPH